MEGLTSLSVVSHIDLVFHNHQVLDDLDINVTLDIKATEVVN